MSNGATSPTSPTKQALNDLRLSGESDRPPDVNGVNGDGHPDGDDDTSSSDDPVVRLQKELERTREEKETLAAQYRNLLSKLTSMRTTLGNKLKQDAEELDRRAQEIEQLSAQNDDLTSTVETLKEELIASNAEAERVASELDNLRTRSFQENAQEAMLRERELREAQTELERCRMEKDEWERKALQESSMAEDAQSSLESLSRDMELERLARQKDKQDLEAEKERSRNLQDVLQDFQAGKEHELRQAVKDHEAQLNQVTQSLAEYKHRALTAELKLEESSSNTTRTQDLEKELKAKEAIIEKLRYEAIILNEHLVEALRRLRRSNTENNVDRRLVTNVLLSFLATPRTDGKRFEMLGLLATILNWSETEREKAGLQRSAISITPSSSFWGRSSTSSAGSPAKGPGSELQKTDETESFSRLWIEFLLTEANAGESNSKSNPNSLPSSPTRPSPPRRLASVSSSPSNLAAPNLKNAMVSSPNLSLPPSLSTKGKEKEVS